MEWEVLKQAIVNVLNVYPDEITEDTTFMEELGADSLDLYQIVMEVEEKLEIQISADEVEGIRTAKEALELLLKHTRG